MDDNALQEAVSSGRVTPFDLIFHEGLWQQLRNVYDMSEIEQGASQIDPNEQEIATQFGDLKPLPGYDKLKKHKKTPPPKAVGEEAQLAAVKKRKIFNVVKIVLKVVAVVVILLFGAERATRIVNFTLHKPSSILIINNYDFAVEFKIGGNDWIVTMPGNMGNSADLSAGFLPQLLKLRVSKEFPPTEGTVAELDQSYILVPLKPNHDTIINLNSKMELGVYDLEGLSDEQVPIGQEMVHLQNAMNTLKQPAAFLDFIKALQKIGSKRFIRKSTELISDSRKFNFGHISVPIARSNMDLTASEEEAREKVHAKTPWLTIPAVCQLNLSGRSFFIYDPDGNSPEGDLEIPFPELTFMQGNTFTNKRPAILHYNLDNQGLYSIHVTIPDLQFTDELGQKVYIRWHYYARQTKNGWNVNWEGIYPFYDEKGKQQSRKISIGSDGKEKRVPEKPEKIYPDPATRKK